MSLGFLVGCGPLPGEVAESTAGSGDSSTSAASTSSATTRGSDGTGSGVDASGSASTSAGPGPGSSEDGTTDAVQPDTSTGDVTTDVDDDATSGGSSGPGSSSGDPGGSSTAASPTCDEIYGMAPGYILCMETDDACHFNANTEPDCNALCPMFGGICLEAFDNPNDMGLECMINRPNMDDCDTDRATELCVCSK